MKGDMEYIRRVYGVPAKRGGRIVYGDVSEEVGGTITGARGSHIRIKLDGSKFSHNFHPTWHIKYLPEVEK
jgi:hypothetical protein